MWVKRALNVRFLAWAVCQMVRLWPGILEDSDQQSTPSEAPMAGFADLKKQIRRYLTGLGDLINDSEARPTQINFMATMFRVLLWTRTVVPHQRPSVHRCQQCT